MDKDKQIKEQEFYLKKQWEEYEEAKKKGETPQSNKSVIPNREFNRRKTYNEEEEMEEKDKKNDYIVNEVLRTPLK